jgi:anti-anti-sigma factor
MARAYCLVVVVVPNVAIAKDIVMIEEAEWHPASPRAGLSVDLSSDGDRGVLVAVGEVDAETASVLVSAGLAALARADLAALDLDLSQVSFIDSTGIGALVAIRNDALARGKTLTVPNPSSRVMEVLAITALDTVFVAVPTGLTEATTGRSG